MPEQDRFCYFVAYDEGSKNRGQVCLASGLRVGLKENCEKSSICNILFKNQKRYWYNNGCLYPDMATVFIPVDKCTKSNGCLQVHENGFYIIYISFYDSVSLK